MHLTVGWLTGNPFKEATIQEVHLRHCEITATGALSTDALRENAIDFLNAGLDLLFHKPLDQRRGKLTLVALQTAVELLVKYRLVQEQGLSAILVKKKTDTVVDLNTARTITYSDSLEKVEGLEGLLDWDRYVIDEMAAMRNRLVHFTAEIDLERLALQCYAIACTALAMFAMGRARDNGEMSDYRMFLSESNFRGLTENKSYRSEALDAAYDCLDTEGVKYCYKCKCESLSLRVSDVYFCHCCGFSINKEVVGFADCISCESRSMVFYDAYNTTGVSHYARCIACEVFQWVERCSECDGKIVTTTPQLQTSCNCRCDK